MASGIGPGLDIDLPVGQNLQDQNYFGITFRTNITTYSQLANPDYYASALEEYLTNQTGPLTTSSANWNGWQKLNGSGDWPDMLILPVPSQTTATPPGNYFSLQAVMLKTTSVGNVTLDSVNLPWLRSEEDQQAAVAAFRRLREVANATGIAEEYAPGLGVQTNNEILDYIRETIVPIHHAACTCAMGKVVDSHAKVFGVDGLRVVDVSTFALLPPGYPQAMVYVLAEKIAVDVLSGR